MTLEKTSTSQRKIRYTVYLNEDENTLLRNDAINVKGYSQKAVGKYIREQVLTPLSNAKKTPSISIPAINSDTAADLRGAVTNLNQSVRTLNTIALSSSISSQKAEAEKMMVQVLEIAALCKDHKNFLEGNIENKRLLARLTVSNFSSENLRSFADQKDARRAK